MIKDEQRAGSDFKMQVIEKPNFCNKLITSSANGKLKLINFDKIVKIYSHSAKEKERKTFRKRRQTWRKEIE